MLLLPLLSEDVEDEAESDEPDDFDAPESEDEPLDEPDDEDPLDEESDDDEDGLAAELLDEVLRLSFR